MMDSFSEQLIRRRKTLVEKIMAVGMTVMAVALICSLIVLAIFPSRTAFGSLVTFVSLLAAAGVGYLAYFVITSGNVEFEYTITNGTLDVDKIIAQRKRKRLISMELSDAEQFGVFHPSEHAQKHYDRQIHAAGGWGGPYYYAVVRSKSRGLTLLVLEPNEKTLDLIRKFLPRPVAQEAFETGRAHG